MLNTLPKTARQQTICEANFLRLKRVLSNFKENVYRFNVVNPDRSSFLVTFNVIHKTKHTLIIEAKQNSEDTSLNNFIIRIQVSIDAKLAEVISYQDYVDLNGEQKAKEEGKLRLEGKDYILKDGDVVHFRFNV